MSGRIAFPFLTLREGSLRTEPWRIAAQGEEPTEVGEWLADWDPAVSLRATRSIGVDFKAAAEDLQMGPDDLELAVALRVGTGSGRLPRALIHRERHILHLDTPLIHVDLAIDGSKLSVIL